MQFHWGSGRMRRFWRVHGNQVLSLHDSTDISLGKWWIGDRLWDTQSKLRKVSHLI